MAGPYLPRPDGRQWRGHAAWHVPWPASAGASAAAATCAKPRGQIQARRSQLRHRMGNELAEDTKVESRTRDVVHTKGHTEKHPEVHDEIEFLLQGKHSSHAIADVIHLLPWRRDDILDYVQIHYGNSMATAVMEALRAMPKPTDHVSDVKGVGELAKGGGSTRQADGSAVSSDMRLPFTSGISWDAILIGTYLGQHDDLAGTNNDGDRCAFATVMMAKVFEGPKSFASWITGFQSTKRPQGLLTERAQAASRVMERVVAVIGSCEATFGDLAYLQEALYDYAIVATGANAAMGVDKVGVSSTEDALSSATEWLDTKGSTDCKDADEVMTAVKGIGAGQQVMVEYEAAPAGGGERFKHQMMIVNQGGTKYLYDAEVTADGEHLHVLTKPYLKKNYFDPRFRKDVTFTLAGTLKHKTTK